MKFEQMPSASPLENPQMRKRVEDASKKDNHYEDTMYDIAQSEDAHREFLEKRGITEAALLNELGDIHSTEVLGRLEAEKERWVDNMTGLRNKNAFSEEGVYFLNLEKRLGQNCALLMLDFDFFKRVNDEFGHSAGDEALKQIAKIIEKSIRSSDVAYRYGGEEFAVILPNTDANGGVVAAENIRKAVEQATIVVHDKEGRQVDLKKTISVGVASTEALPDWSNSVEDLSNDEVREQFLDTLVVNADGALYNSKQNGRNQVSVAGIEKEQA
jgi:diguanylate cyclase (GGDEF)-like protein